MGYPDPNRLWNWNWPKYPKGYFFRDFIIFALLLTIAYLTRP